LNRYVTRLQRSSDTPEMSTRAPLSTASHSQPAPTSPPVGATDEQDVQPDDGEPDAPLVTVAQDAATDSDHTALVQRGVAELEVAPMASTDRATPSGASVLTSELIGGLRTAGRHFSKPSASESHLRAELTIVARRLDSLVMAQDAADASWAIAAMSLVHDAGAALDQRRIADGWQLLRAAQTEMLEGQDVRSLEVELAQLTSSPMVIDDNAPVEQLRTEVWALHQTRNTYLAELERRLSDSARRLLYQGVLMLTLLVVSGLGVLFDPPSSDTGDALGSLGSYLTIVGLAMTGAAVSNVLFTRSSARSAALSEVANPLHIMLLRVTFGGVVGLLVVVLLQADIQSLLNVAGLAAYPWAIAGGFSERFVDRAIDRAETDAEDAAADACGGIRP
jgi:hypothetical protein